MVQGLAELEQLCWDHFDCRFGVAVGHESSEDTNECNGCRCFI